LQFWGASFVADPHGQLLHRASQLDEEIVIARCDLNSMDSIRTHWPFLRDRRIDAYGDLARRFID
jgi:N-carbamoylputrescine amidase